MQQAPADEGARHRRLRQRRVAERADDAVGLREHAARPHGGLFPRPHQQPRVRPLKGYQIGGAQISEKHAGFIINKNNATTKDILDLIEYTKKKVFEKFGVHIEEEIEII